MNICRHCRRPECVPACPKEAIRIDENAIVLVDLEKCDRCQNEDTPKCVEACPYDGIHLDCLTGKALKCDLCGGSNFACVEACPHGVLIVKGVSTVD